MISAQDGNGLYELQTRRPPRLRRYLVLSLVLHGVLFGLIVHLVRSEQRRVAHQEQQFIADVKAEEQRREQEELAAQQEAAEDMLAEQVQIELDALIEDELAPPDEAALSEMTHEDVQQRVEQLDQQQDIGQLSGEQLYETLANLSGEALAQMRANLRQMKQDLLLSQVRTYVRTTVAPEIQRKVESKLKNELGQRIRDEAQRQSNQQRKERLESVSTRLQQVIKDLSQTKREQDQVGNEIRRTRFDEAAKRQAAVKESAAEQAERVAEVLRDVQRVSPALAEQARSLQSEQTGREIAPAVERSAAVVAQADTAETDRREKAEAERKIRSDRKAQQENPDALKSAQQDLAEADKAARETKAAAEAESREVGERVAERTRALLDLSQKLVEQTRQTAPDDVQRQVVDAALDQVKEAVREKIRQEVHETAIPVAADRIVEALRQDLERRKLNTPEFKKFLESDIRAALAEEAAQREPDPELAMQQTRERFDIRESESLEEARKEVAAIAAKLQALSESQEKLRDEARKESAPRHAADQRDLGKQIRDVREQAGRTLGRARAATLDHGNDVNAAERTVAQTRAEEASDDAVEALDHEALDKAKPLMTETAAVLKESAEAMKQLDKQLADEAAKVQQVARVEVDLSKALGPEAAGEAVREVEQAAEKAVEQRAKPEMEQVARSLKIGKILAEAESAEALGRMDALEEKLDQVAANLAEGRGLADMLGMELPGRGLGGIPGGENLPWYVPNRRAMSQFNRKLYEEFVKDMRERLNPDNYYGEAAAPDAVESSVRTEPTETAAVIFVEELPQKKEPAKAERQVPEPDFPHLAFAAAAMMDKPVTIDGDLSDWGELRHGLKMQYNTLSETQKIADGPTLYLRWSPDGIYVGYVVKDPNGIQPCKDHPWSGDCLEWMIDTANSRLPDAYMNAYAQKFCFTPFGCRGSTAVKVWEMGRGLRGMSMARDYPDSKGTMGKTAAKLIPGYGYSVECFLDRRALVRPQLVPGKYLAVNFSVNQGYTSSEMTQWSASQKLQTWHRPDTWGDLLLLGSDARLKFVAAGESAEDAATVAAVVPGDAVGLEIADADMNVNTQKVDRIAAEVVSKKTGATLLVVLNETGPGTGIFRASINTQPYFMPPKENTLNVSGGDTVQLSYTDARCEYGEKNVKRTADLVVGWPVMKVGSN
ncbi:MAG: hypothetical protein JXL80_05590 [Planctomycetes bacterium]|nr:hypothetical protein [Planctomycetota bacterium]